MNYLIVCTLVFCSIFASANDQIMPVEALSRKVDSLHQLRLKHYNSPQRDTIFAQFDTAMALLFRHPGFCQYSTSLSVPKEENATGKDHAYHFMNNNTVIASTNGKVRVFSWDDLGGGSYHSYTNFIQFERADQTCTIIPFDVDEGVTEAGYYALEEMKDNGRIIYVLLGYGTYGGGKQHWVVRFYEISNDQFVECLDCYPNKKDVVISCNRVQNPDLIFDEKQQEIKYKQFHYDGNIGFYTNTFDQIRLRFKDGKMIAE